MKRLVLTAAAVLVAGLGATAAISDSDASRLSAAARVVQDVNTTISQGYWERARCVIVIPELKKAAFIIGAEYGKPRLLHRLRRSPRPICGRALWTCS